MKLNMPADRAMSRNQQPKQRKKRIQIAEQNPQPQQPRQSVFERLGTKNSGTAPIPRPAKNKKEIKDLPSNSNNEPRKARRVSESRQVGICFLKYSYNKTESLHNVHH